MYTRVQSGGIMQMGGWVAFFMSTYFQVLFKWDVVNCSVFDVQNNIRKLVFCKGVSYSPKLTSLWKHWFFRIIFHKHQFTLMRLVHAMRSNGPLPQVKLHMIQGVLIIFCHHCMYIIFHKIYSNIFRQEKGNKNGSEYILHSHMADNTQCNRSTQDMAWHWVEPKTSSFEKMWQKHSHNYKNNPMVRKSGHMVISSTLLYECIWLFPISHWYACSGMNLQ